MPGDFIDRVTSQNGGRVLFERLAIPRPTPKVTSNSCWQTQQQQQQQPQQPNLEDDVQSIWKQRATWESRAGVRYDTKHATEVERATRQLVLPTSEAEAETQLTVKEELTDTNTKEIGRINNGSNKTCSREDLAKEKMVFSRESSQAIFKMDDVELIELKKSTIQCPSCLHYVFEGTFLCNCGEEGSLRDPESTIPCIYGRDASRGATKGERGFTSQNDAIYRQSQRADNWSDAWVRYLHHIVQFSIFHNAPQQQRERRMHILYLCSADENRQAPPLSQRPGYWEAKEQFRNLQRRKREQVAPFNSESERKRL